MIKTSELMVGNVVWSTEFNRPHIVQWGDCGDYEEIPLTVPIMEHLGMRNRYISFRSMGDIYSLDSVEIVCRDGMFLQSLNFGEYVLCRIHTVHQLQILLTANGLPETAKEVGEKVMEFLEREGRK